MSHDHLGVVTLTLYLPE